jgi:predicted fused transcriptional regulator/phosphomethylpyrimidine kinase
MFKKVKHLSKYAAYINFLQPQRTPDENIKYVHEVIDRARETLMMLESFKLHVNNESVKEKKIKKNMLNHQDN